MIWKVKEKKVKEIKKKKKGGQKERIRKISL